MEESACLVEKMTAPGGIDTVIDDLEEAPVLAGIRDGVDRCTITGQAADIDGWYCQSHESSLAEL